MIDEKVLLERLEEEKQSSPCRNTQCKDCKYTNQCYEGEMCYKVGIEKIVNQLAEEYNNDFCEWRLCDEEANVYDTTCRNPHILIEGSPTDNNYEFCPYCGKKIKVVE